MKKQHKPIYECMSCWGFRLAYQVGFLEELVITVGLFWLSRTTGTKATGGQAHWGLRGGWENNVQGMVTVAGAEGLRGANSMFNVQEGAAVRNTGPKAQHFTLCNLNNLLKPETPCQGKRNKSKTVSVVRRASEDGPLKPVHRNYWSQSQGPQHI